MSTYPAVGITATGTKTKAAGAEEGEGGMTRVVGPDGALKQRRVPLFAPEGGRNRLRLRHGLAAVVFTSILLVLLLVGGAAAPSPAEAATSSLKLAPLNPAFVTWQAGRVEAAAGLTAGDTLGERPSPQDLSSAQGSEVPRTEATASTLPSSYDLRTIGRVTSVKDQGSYGTCWAFATFGSLESCLMPTENDDFSEDNLVLTSGFDNGGDPYNAGGNFFMSTAYLVRWAGPVFASDEPYGSDYVPAGLSPRKHVQAVDWIPPRSSSLDNDSIKNAVVRFGGVDAEMDWYDSSAGSTYYNATAASYYYDGSSGGTPAGHAVVVVGWDDNYPATDFATTPPGDGAFICKNSWGTAWGDDGYFYISYYDVDFARVSASAVFMDAEPTSNYAGIYQYDPLGDVGSVGYSSSTAWFANAFSARTASDLSAVGFYTLTPGTSYEVYTGSSLASLAPNGGGTLDYMGYHTVALSSPVALAGGQPFVVAVEINSPSTGYPIAVEYPVAGYSSAATAQSGGSYVSSDGTSWSDLTTTWNTNANVCLKAYVTATVGPTISSISPASGPTGGGTAVTITGANLADVTAVSFGGTPAAYTVNSATRITATAPAHAAGTVNVVVTSPEGSSISGSTAQFTYAAPVHAAPPAVTGISPRSGPAGGGTLVSVTGTNFSGATSVKFGAGKATGVSVNGAGTQITCASPSGSGVVDVTVTTAGGTSATSSSDRFTYVPVPVVRGLSPASGTTSGRTGVIITGTDFIGVAGAGAVTFGGVDAISYTVDSSTQISAIAPAHAVGTVTVRVAGSGGTTTPGATSQFTYVAAPTTTRYEQTASSLVWSGTWGLLRTTSASGGNLRYVNASGASVTVSFSGTYLAWIAKTGTDYGIAKVTLDGTKTFLVDLYSAVTTYKKKVWDTGILPSGFHWVTIQWTGTKNSASRAAYIDLDAVYVAKSLTGVAKYQQNYQIKAGTTAIAYTPGGAWATFGTIGASGGSYIRARTSGSQATIKFTGIRFDWIATKGTTLGKADVYLDGVLMTTVDLAATRVAYQQDVWSTGFIAPGVHTVVIKWNSNNLAGKYVSLDRADIRGVILQAP